MNIKINLPTNGFAPFKVVFGSCIVLLFILFREPMVALAPLIALAVGKAHSLGAWVSMWKAGKLNYKYVACLTAFIIIFTYLGIYVWSISILTFVTGALFIFHFMYDEFDLQEEGRELSKFVAPTTFFILSVVYLLQFGGVLFLHTYVYFTIMFFAILVEMIFIKEITWHFINMKILQFLLLFFVYFQINALYFVTTTLMWHYLFWFIYPVYKVHKYKREERDGLILILFIIVISSTFFSYTQEINVSVLKDMTWRYFDIVTIVHILGTAPFGYLFFLPKSRYKVN